MKLDWNRIKRTAIQSATGAGVAMLTAIAADFSKQAVIAAVIQFLCTVAVAVLMNIKTQTEENKKEEKK